MPGLWLLAPGNQVFWQLQPEENFPIAKEPGPVFSLLVSIKKCSKQLKSGPTGKERKKVRIRMCINYIILGSLSLAVEFLCQGHFSYLSVSEVSMENYS